MGATGPLMVRPVHDILTETPYTGLPDARAVHTALMTRKPTAYDAPLPKGVIPDAVMLTMAVQEKIARRELEAARMEELAKRGEIERQQMEAARQVGEQRRLADEERKLERLKRGEPLVEKVEMVEKVDPRVLDVELRPRWRPGYASGAWGGTLMGGYGYYGASAPPGFW